LGSGRELPKTDQIVVEGCVALSETEKLVLALLTVVLIAEETIDGCHEQIVVGHKTLGILELAVVVEGDVSGRGTRHTLECIGDAILIRLQGLRKATCLGLELGLEDSEAHITIRSLELVSER